MDYKVYDDVVVCPIPEDSELDFAEINNIVEHTHILIDYIGYLK